MSEPRQAYSSTLEEESAYYGLAIRWSYIVALLLCLGAFLLLPREFEVKAYQPRQQAVTAMEEMPELTEPEAAPEQPKPAAMPVAAASEAEVEAATVAATTFTEVAKRATDTDVPIVPFWKVEVKPQQISVPKPEYPDMARSAGIEGTAVVEALVDVDGSVGEARVLKTSGNQSLDQAAVAAAMLAKFKPAMQRDMPVRVWVSIPYRFSLQ